MKKRILSVIAAALVLSLCSCGRTPSADSQPDQGQSSQGHAFGEPASQEQKAPESKTIQQVLPLKDGSVAVLYTDGTAKAAGNSALSQAVSNWSSVEQICLQQKFEWTDAGVLDQSFLLGLREDGTVVSTGEDFSGWQNIKKIDLSSGSAVGLTEDGRILMDHTDYESSFQSVLTDMQNVEDLLFWDHDEVMILKKDGTAQYANTFDGLETSVIWDNVKEIRNSGHAFYGIREDGEVTGGFEASYPGLSQAVKIVHYDDLLFGISPEGRLLTHNGGNIYTNAGCFYVDAPGASDYSGEVDISSYDQVRDLLPFYGLVLLNQDGTVSSIGEPAWAVSGWENIEKVCGVNGADWDMEQTYLYGLREDGSVIRTGYNGVQEDRYRGWQLQEIYPGTGGVIGLTTDGKLVGDGIFENTDLMGL